jgi:hypothetical protein
VSGHSQSDTGKFEKRVRYGTIDPSGEEYKGHNINMHSQAGINRHFEEFKQ